MSFSSSEEMFAAAEKMVAEAERLREYEESKPVEPIHIGTEEESEYNVIAFQKQFSLSSPVYSYAALAVVDKYGRQYWYVTGAVHGKEKWTWEELLEFIGEEFWETIVPMVEGDPLV